MSAPVPMGLTQRQGEVLAFVRQYIAANGRPPALQEIADGTGIKGKGQIHTHLRALEERGHIKRLPYKERSIVVIAPTPESFYLPPQVWAALDALCARTGDSRAAVVVDAVTLHVDEATLDLTKIALAEASAS